MTSSGSTPGRIRSNPLTPDPDRVDTRSESENIGSLLCCRPRLKLYIGSHNNDERSEFRVQCHDYNNNPRQKVRPNYKMRIVKISMRLGIANCYCWMSITNPRRWRLPFFFPFFWINYTYTSTSFALFHITLIYFQKLYIIWPKSHSDKTCLLKRSQRKYQFQVFLNHLWFV